MPSSTTSLPLTDVVSFIIQKSSHEVGITRLMKLVYLADVEHVQQYGEQMCDIKWIWYDFGPFSSRVYEAVEALDAEGVLDDVLVANRRTIDTSDLTGRNVESKLGARQRYILQRTLSRYGSLTLSAIRHVTHTTRTVMQAEPNGPLDVLQQPRRSLVESNPALSALLARSSEPDCRSWGDPDESTSEDLEILTEFSELRRAANEA